MLLPFRLLPILLLPILLGFSATALASLEGTFIGTGTATFQCLGPTGPFSANTQVQLVATGTDYSLSIRDTAGTYSYNGTGTISQDGNDFFFNTSGDVTINVGNAAIDDTYTPSFINFSYEQNGEELILIGGPTPSPEIVAGAGACSDLDGILSITLTLSDLSPAGGGGQLIITEETPGSSVTDALLFNTQIQNTVNGINRRINGALSAIKSLVTPRFTDNGFGLHGQTGLNAGDEDTLPFGVWGNYSYTNFENDLSSTAFDGSSHGFLGGVDVAAWNNAIIGVALGFDTADIDTGFNNGNQKAETFTIAPYYGAILSDIISVDFNFGYSYVDYDQFRTSGATRIGSTPTADRLFGSFNLSTIYFVDRWVLGSRVGFLYARSTIDSYTESDGTIIADLATRVGTFSLAGDAAYSFGNYEPFLNLAYQYDLTLTEVGVGSGPVPANDKDDILLTAGIRYFEKSGISGNLEYSKRFLRENFDEDRLSVTLRIDY